MSPIFEDATSQLNQMAAGTLTSEALLDTLRERVEGSEAQLGAVVASNFERARARARQADQARGRGESWGPLHGLPLTVKDTYEVTGMPTTSGSPKFRDHRASAHAVAVQKLVDAGAVVFGKTNLPVFAGEWQSFNPVYGTTHNPYDLARTPGGSSGGSAAALAGGLTALELGSDIGGSIRIPCHFCGVFGHKPTHGAIPLRGHIPGPPGTMGTPDLAVAGPMARSARDLSLAFEVLLGDEARLMLEAESGPTSLSELRIGVWREDPAAPLESDVAEVLSRGLDTLSDAGAQLDETRPAGLDLAKVMRTYVPLLSGIIGTGLPLSQFRLLQWMAPLAQWWARKKVPSEIPPLFLQGVVQTHREWLSRNEARAKMAAKVEAWFEDYDLLVTPVAAWSAFPHAQSGASLFRMIDTPSGPRPYADHLYWVGLATTLGLPSTSVPVGLGPSGLPVGLQVIAPRGQDRRCLAAASTFEEVLGGFTPPA